MQGYEKVQKEKEQTVENEIRVMAKGQIKKYLGYALRILTKTDFKSLEIRGTGNAIVKALILIELVKRRVGDLHQVNNITSTEIVDEFRPIVEGLEKVEQRRRVTCLNCVLSKEPLDSSNIGYQEPTKKEEQTQRRFNDDNNKGGETRPRGAPRGGPRGRGGYRGDRGDRGDRNERQNQADRVDNRGERGERRGGRDGKPPRVYNDLSPKEDRRQGETRFEQRHDDRDRQDFRRGGDRDDGRQYRGRGGPRYRQDAVRDDQDLPRRGGRGGLEFNDRPQRGGRGIRGNDDNFRGGMRRGRGEEPFRGRPQRTDFQERNFDQEPRGNYRGGRDFDAPRDFEQRGGYRGGDRPYRGRGGYRGGDDFGRGGFRGGDDLGRGGFRGGDRPYRGRGGFRGGDEVGRPTQGFRDEQNEGGYPPRGERRGGNGGPRRGGFNADRPYNERNEGGFSGYRGDRGDRGDRPRGGPRYNQ